jgi:hypothetical protein
MTNATLRRAASRPGAQIAPRTAGSFGLLQVAIVVLTVATALVHLDKALALSVFGIHLGWIPGAMPANFHPGGAAGPGHAGPGAGGRPMGAPRGGMMLPLPFPLPVLFFFNFVGNAILLVALYVPLPRLARFQQRYHRVIRWVLIAFAAATILGYFAIVGTNQNALGEFDKAMEIALIVFLLLEDGYSRVVARMALA